MIGHDLRVEMATIHGLPIQADDMRPIIDRLREAEGQINLLKLALEDAVSALDGIESDLRFMATNEDDPMCEEDAEAVLAIAADALAARRAAEALA